MDDHWTGRTDILLEPKSYQPLQVDHWRAARTDWQPIRRQQSSVKMRLHSKPGKGLILGPTVATYGRYAFFIVPGVLAMSIGVPWLLLMGEYWAALFAAIWALLFLSVTWFMIQQAPWVFNADQNRFYKGFDWFLIHYTSVKERRLSDIVALQVLPLYKLTPEGIPRKKSFDRYQLNLVLENGVRHVLLDSEQHAMVMTCADQLSDYCHCPVWEGKYDPDRSP